MRVLECVPDKISLYLIKTLARLYGGIHETKTIVSSCTYEFKFVTCSRGPGDYEKVRRGEKENGGRKMNK